MLELMAVEGLIYCQSGSIPKRRISEITEEIFGADTIEYALIMHACKMSCDTHRGKVRENGEPVINHERSMFIIATQYLGIFDPVLLIAIFMHDMHEDYPLEWPLTRIRSEFGIYGYEVSQIVFAVSKPDLNGRSWNDPDFNREVISRVIDGGVKACVLKCIDRLHNKLTPFDQARDKLIWKIVQTMKYIIPMSLEVETLSLELQLAVTKQIITFKITSSELASVNI